MVENDIFAIISSIRANTMTNQQKSVQMHSTKLQRKSRQQINLQQITNSQMQKMNKQWSVSSSSRKFGAGSSKSKQIPRAAELRSARCCRLFFWRFLYKFREGMLHALRAC